MSALAQCDAFAFIYDQAGDPAPDILVVLKRVLDASGNSILLGPKTTLTDSAGAFHFTLPELSTAFISARASALWNCPDGRAFTVPPGPSGELVPDFSLPASTLVEPPLVYVGDVLSIPRASATQDGYLSAADFVAFEAGAAEMGITQIDTGAGLTGGPITDTGTIGLLPVSGVAGTWANPSSITVNAYGQIIAIAGVADTTAPVISAISAGTPGPASATITWTTDDFSDSQVEYGTSTGYGTTTMLDSTPVTSHSVSIGSLTGLTGYHYRVKSQNTAGLLTTSGDNTFTTTAVVDTTPPVITAISSGTPTDISATITWTTDDASDSQVEYGPTTSYGTSTTLDATMTTGHSVPLTGLTAATGYHYRVKSRNAASLLTTSSDNTFTTAAAPPVVHLLTNLISMWQLEETGSTLRADSMALHPLNPSGPITAATGKIGLASHFIADTHDLASLSTVDLQTGDIDYTIACWVNLDDLTGFSGGSDIVAKATGNAGEHEYSVDYSATDNKFRLTVGGGTTFTYTSVLASAPTPAVVGTWYLVVCWHQVSDGKIYIQVNNGTPDAVVRTEPMYTSGSASLAVGSYGVGVPAVNFMLGLVDELAFWSGRVLSVDDRAALWNGGAGLPFGSWT